MATASSADLGLSTERVPVFQAGEDGSIGPEVEVHFFGPDHPRVRVGVHAHHDLEILYFSRGVGEHRVGHRVLPFAAGDVFLVPPAVPHDLTGLHDAVGWALEFSPSALESVAGAPQSLLLWRANPLLSPFLEAAGSTAPGHLSVALRHRPRWERLLVDLQQELEYRPVGYRLSASALLVLVLVHVARLAKDYTAQWREHDEPVLAACFEVIEKRFHGPLPLDDIARALGLSPGHLTGLVRGKTGRTVVEWVTERRMSEARQLLLTTDLPAEVIARRVGFSDAAYFNRRFRQLHGTPPGTWRRRARGAS